MRVASLVAAGLVALAVSPAAAADALCFTTDDGRYPCEFSGIEGDGSFVISAPGKPTFTVMMLGDGTASASAVFEPGGRSVVLPGIYERSAKDPACWGSDATGTYICAW